MSSIRESVVSSRPFDCPRPYVHNAESYELGLRQRSWQVHASRSPELKDYSRFYESQFQDFNGHHKQLIH